MLFVVFGAFVGLEDAAGAGEVVAEDFFGDGFDEAAVEEGDGAVGGVLGEGVAAVEWWRWGGSG